MFSSKELKNTSFSQIFDDKSTIQSASIVAMGTGLWRWFQRRHIKTYLDRSFMYSSVVKGISRVIFFYSIGDPLKDTCFGVLLESTWSVYTFRSCCLSTFADRVWLFAENLFSRKLVSSSSVRHSLTFWWSWNMCMSSKREETTFNSLFIASSQTKTR